MDPCPFSEIESAFDTTIAAIADSQGIDPVCSTSGWIIPAAAAFSATSEQHVFASSHGYLALLDRPSPNGPILTSFDAMWGFATPIIGSEPAAIVADVAAVLSQLEHTVLVLSGLDPSAALFNEVERQLKPMGYSGTSDRCVVDLSDGFEAWLGRRSSRFRRSLRSAANRGAAEGVTVQHLTPASTDVPATFDRILAIEADSWKSEVDSGLVDTQLGFFTRAMADRFAATDSLRVQFAQLDGADIGYVIGARHGDRYRGFQHSFNQNYPSLSIGKFLQFHTIASLADEGVVTYDMGMHMGYKVSYADRIESTVTAVIPRSR